MRTKTTKTILSTRAFGVCLLGLIWSASMYAEAGHRHHRHHNYGHHYGGYAPIYYQQPYYPQPVYVNNYYPVPAPVYAPAPVYTYPPNVVMDINTGAGHFFFSY